MTSALAASITKAASKQSYYTIRFLVDRDRVDDAYRAYGYFRWVDDVLDTDPDPKSTQQEASTRLAFLERQKSLLESCYRGELPRDVDPREGMLIELVEHDQKKNTGLQSYLRNMMAVMDFDTRRRGRLISQVELNEYTRWLATAVTEALLYFIGHDDSSPSDETRYLAVSAAHIVHMLRDTYDDLLAGYYNIPREVLKANAIEPKDVQSDAYRGWVKNRVLLAREYFREGKDFFARVENPRCRLASFAYISRFEWLLEAIEREDYCLRPQYQERKSVRTGLRMIWSTLSSLANFQEPDVLPPRTVSHPLGKA